MNGLVAGTWKRALQGHSVDITVSPFRALSARETQALEKEGARYAAFLGKERHTIRT